MKRGIRAADIFRLSCRNLWQNKSRTALTVVIVAVVSALIMLVCVLGVSFLRNLTEGERETLEYTGTEYTMSSKITAMMGPYREYEPITAEDAETFGAIADQYASVIDRKEYVLAENSAENKADYAASFRLHWNLPEELRDSPEKYAEEYYNWWDDDYKLYLSRLTVADLDGYTFGGAEKAVQGRLWESADNGLPAVWVGSEYVAAQAQKGIKISVGSTATFTAGHEDFENPNQRIYRLYNCTVEGIFDSESTRVMSGGYKTAAKQLIVGKDFLQMFAEDACIDRIELSYAPPALYDYWGVYGQMKDFVREVNEEIPPYMLSGRERVRFSCTYVDAMKTIDLLGAVMAAVLVAVSMLILLLSIGSVVNTILISVDKNKRFLGLLKALGMKQGDLRKMIGAETLLMVAAGAALGVGLLYALRGAILSLLRSIFSTMFSELPFGIAVGVWVPFWLPLATAAAFFAFALLFSRRSVNAFAARDVIGTVSEVA